MGKIAESGWRGESRKVGGEGRVGGKWVGRGNRGKWVERGVGK